LVPTVVVDEFDLDREIVSIGMNYVDRFYSSNSNIISLLDDDTTSSDFGDHIQLLSMAALWLALKLKNGRAVIIPQSESTMQTLLKLGRDKFSQEQLVKMEVQLLQHLRWLVHPPTPQFYISYFFSHCTPTQETQETIDEWNNLAIYYVELTTLDFYFVSVKSSLLAFTALVNAAETMIIMGSSWVTNIENMFLTNSFEQKVFDACKERLTLLVASVGQIDDDPNVDPSRTASPTSVAQF
jgi:hypothetical protein